MDAGDRIWNRAAMQGGGDKPAAGDRALADALSFHSLAMSGGVLDAVERSDNLTAVEDGFRWLGLDRIAELLASVRHDIDAGALDDEDRIEALEQEADERYNAVLTSDADLEAAFRRRLVENPTAFAES
jgi:hypothetical protein